MDPREEIQVQKKKTKQKTHNNIYTTIQMSVMFF